MPLIFGEGDAVIALNCAHDGTTHSLLKRRGLRCDFIFYKT